MAVWVTPALRSWVERLARLSYVTKGILFLSIGWVLLQAVVSRAVIKPNRKEALELWESEPWGWALLAFVTVTFAGHTLWRLLEVWFDPYGKGTSAGGLIYRLTYLLSGISYGALALTAGQLLWSGKAGPDDQKRIWVQQALTHAWGPWLVAGVGGIILLWGLVQGYKGVTGTVVQKLAIDHLPPVWRGLIRVAGCVGFVALAVTLIGIGTHLIRSAWLIDPEQVRNSDDILVELARLGRPLVLLEAIGLQLFGLFMLAMARYFPFKAA